MSKAILRETRLKGRAVGTRACDGAKRTESCFSGALDITRVVPDDNGLKERTPTATSIPSSSSGLGRLVLWRDGEMPYPGRSEGGRAQAGGSAKVYGTLEREDAERRRSLEPGSKSRVTEGCKWSMSSTSGKMDNGTCTMLVDCVGLDEG